MGIPGSLRPMSHPLTNELAQQIMNYDAFRKENIVKEKDTAGMSWGEKTLEGAKQRGAHAFSTFAPTPVVDVVKGAEAFRQEPQGRFGRVRPMGVVAADALAGVKLYPVDYAEQMMNKISKLDPQKGEIARRLKTDINRLAVKKKVTEERGGEGARYQREIDRKIRQMVGLAEELKEFSGAFGQIKKEAAR